MNFFLYDLKRIFASKTLVILALLSPALVIVILATVFFPMIGTAQSINFNLAICNEDKSDDVNQFVNQLVNSQALSEIVNPYPVSSVEVGLELIENNSVSVLIHIPDNLLSDIREGKEVDVSIYSTENHSMESELVSMILDTSLNIVGQGQNVVGTSYDVLLDKGVDKVSTDYFIDEITSEVISDYMSRRDIIGESGTVSPVGEYMPVEYYLSAVFTIFVCLTMLPLIHFTSSDLSSSIIKRGLLSGITSTNFFISRILSGAVLIFLVQIMILPTSLGLKFFDYILGGNYGSHYFALFICIILSSLCFSSLSFLLSLTLKNERLSLWMGFYLSIFLCFISGAIIPSSILPSFLVSIGLFSPARYCMRALSNSLFNFKFDSFIDNAVIIFCFFTLFFIISFFLFKRRENMK